MIRPKSIYQEAAGRKHLAVMVLSTVVMVVWVSGVMAQDIMSAHHHVDSEPSATQGNTQQREDWARARLAKSPRHQEWVDVKYGNRTVKSFVVYPEVKKKATAVVVIHEIFGMSDWVQALTDELAEAGYIAIAPDLLSGMAPNGGGTDELAVSNGVGQAIGKLPPDQITSDLNAVADYVSKLPAANGKVAVAGFCWGGSQSFRFATNRPTLKAAFVFYGSAPTTQPPDPKVDKAALDKIKAPVYGFYAGNDARIGATVPATTDAMKELKKTYDIVTYDGAGHGFMRAGDAPEPAADASQAVRDGYPANKKGRDAAWERWKEILNDTATAPRPVATAPPVAPQPSSPCADIDYLGVIQAVTGGGLMAGRNAYGGRVRNRASYTKEVEFAWVMNGRAETGTFRIPAGQFIDVNLGQGPAPPTNVRVVTCR